MEPFERWAEALGLREFDLVGHSFGGFVCAAWAARGAGVRRMGLLSPLLGFSDERISRLRPAEDGFARGPRARARPRMPSAPHHLCVFGRGSSEHQVTVFCRPD